MSRRIFSILLTATIFIGLIPVFSVGASSDIVDLIHDADGSVRTGVVPSYYGVWNGITYSDDYDESIIDGIDSSESSPQIASYHSGGPGGYYQVDLGAVRTITYIKYSMLHNGFTANTWRHDNNRILLSNDPNFATYEVVATVGLLDEDGTTMPRHYEVDMSGNGTGFSYDTTVVQDNLVTTGTSAYDRTVTFAGESKRYRYVRVEKIDSTRAGTHGMSCNEIVVRGSECSRESFGAWSVADNMEGTERTFSIPVTYENALSEREFDIMAASYDQAGKMTALVPSSDGGAELSAAIPVVSTDVKSIAVALPKDDDYLFIPPVAAYGFSGFNTDSGTATDFDTANTLSTGDDYVQVNGKAVSPYDLIIAKAVKSDAANADEAFSGNPTLSWYGAAIANNGYSFKMPFSEEGKYYIRITRYPLNESPEYVDYDFSMVDPQDRTAAIAAIMSATTDDELKSAVDYAVDTTGVISGAALIQRSSFEEEGIIDIFTDISTLMADSDISLGEIVQILNTTSVVFDLSEGDNTLYHANSDLVNDNADVKNYVQDELKYSFTASVSSSIADGATGVTNIDSVGTITYTFTDNMKPSSLTSSNVVIKKNGSRISYSPYQKDESSFVIDKKILASNSEYEISFGPGCMTLGDYKFIDNPTFTFTTGEIINAPYKEGYVIKNVSRGKTVSNVNVDTSLAAASTVVDGNKSNFVWFRYEEPVIDLGDYYDVFRIDIVGPDAARTGHVREASVLANKSDATFSEDNITLYTYPSSDTDLQQLSELTLNVDEGMLRYFKLKHGTSTWLIREFLAYAYVKYEFGDWVAPTFNGAGSYTFSKPITENTGAGTYYMFLNAYDANGYTTESKVLQVSEQSGKLTGSITAPSGTVGISAAIVSDLASMKQITDPITIGTQITNSGTTDSGVSIIATDSGAQIKVGKSATIDKTSRVIVEVVSTTESGVTAEQAFASMTASQIENDLEFMSAVKCADGINYVLDNLPVGKYYVRVNITDLEGNSTDSYYKFAIINSGDKTNLINEFMGANSSGLKTWTTSALDTTEIISYDDLKDTTVLQNDDYYALVQHTRDMLYPQSADVTEISQIAEILNAAAVVKSCVDGNALKSTQLIEEAGALLGANFDTNVNVEKFLTVLNKLKTNITDGTSLGNVLRRAGMLSYMQGGTDENKISVLNNYASEFGVNLAYAATKGVTVERAAAYLNCADVSIYYPVNALNNAFIAAVNSAAGESSGSSDTIVNNSTPTISGSVSFGGNSGAPVSPMPVPDVKDPAENSGNALFSDMAAYGWANEAVRVLCEQNVINGYEDGTFKPENNVTRAEFIKMLAVATKVQVVEEMPMNFIDVPDDSWYYPYIRIAFTNSLCSGVSDYYFNPDSYITRQDMAVLVYNYLKFAGQTSTGQSRTFTDSADIADYAKAAVEEASAAGIINGFDDGSFRGKENARRVDAAMIISKIIG